VLSVGKQEFNERKNFQLNESNPKFYKMFEFRGVFPGCNTLKIKMMDYDDFFGDNLIGETEIDLEERFFSVEW